MTPTRVRILGVMAAAVLVGAVALVFALQPAPSEPAYVPSPPLQLPASGVPAATPLSAGVSATIRIIAPAGQINIGVVPGDLGDEVRVILKDGSQLVFHVVALKVVSFDDWAVLDPTPFPELTLLTCVSYTAYEPRYIVIATET